MTKLLVASVLLILAGCTTHHTHLGWARFGTDRIAFASDVGGPRPGAAETLRDDFSNALEIAFSPPALHTNESEFPFAQETVLLKFSYAAALPTGSLAVFFPLADDRHVKVLHAWRGASGTDMHVLLQTSRLGAESLRAAISSAQGLRGVATFPDSTIELVCRDEQPHFKCVSVWLTRGPNGRRYVTFENLTERSIQLDTLTWSGGHLDLHGELQPGHSLTFDANLVPLEQLDPAKPIDLRLTKQVLTFIPAQFIQRRQYLFEGAAR